MQLGAKISAASRDPHLPRAVGGGFPGRRARSVLPQSAGSTGQPAGDCSTSARTVPAPCFLALAGSMLTFIVFVLSALLIVVQLAIGQLTPRVIAIVFARPGVKAVLAMLTFTYVYTLSALARIEDRVPDLHVSLAVILNLACIGGFLLFVQQLSSGLRPTSVMQERRPPLSGRDPGTLPRRLLAWTHRANCPAVTSRRPPCGSSRHPAGLGWSWRSARRHLVRLATGANAVIELVPEVGDFLATDDPLFRVFGEDRPISEDAPARVRRDRRRTDPGAGPPVCVPNPCRYCDQGPVPSDQRPDHRGARTRPDPQPAPRDRPSAARRRPGPGPGRCI